MCHDWEGVALSSGVLVTQDRGNARPLGQEWVSDGKGRGSRGIVSGNLEGRKTFEM